MVSGVAADPPQANDEPTPDQETELQQEGRRRAGAVTLSAVVDGKVRDLEMLKEPVLRFGDAARSNDRGSVWIWQRADRPQAIMELYRGTDGQSWVYVIHSLAEDSLEGDFGEGAQRWAPAAAGIKWHDFAGAPVPAERPLVRARQIKDLSQKFTAHEFWDPNNSRYELRLLVRAVHKYNNPDVGVLEGAVFLLCHETNPEVALLIEAVAPSGGEAKFRYALARLGHAELHVEFHQTEVWRQDRIDNATLRDPYYLVLK
jgi:hypothetical protein